MMNADTPIDLNDLKTLKARWERVGPILEDIRQREHFALTDEERLERIVDVLSLVPEVRRPRFSSGFAEFYRRLRGSCSE